MAAVAAPAGGRWVLSSSSVMLTPVSLGALPRNSGWSVFLDSLATKVKDYVKLLGYGAFWINRSLETPFAPLIQFSAQMGVFKNLLSGRELFKGVVEFGQNSYFVATRLRNGFSSEMQKAARKVITGAGDIFNNVKDVVEFASTFVACHVTVLTVLKTFAPWVSGVGAALNAEEECEKLWCSSDLSGDQKSLSMMKLAMHVTYLAVSVFSIICTAMGVAVSVPVLVGMLTFATLMGLGSHFYDKLYVNNIDMEAVRNRIDFS